MLNMSFKGKVRFEGEDVVNRFKLKSTSTLAEIRNNVDLFYPLLTGLNYQVLWKDSQGDLTCIHNDDDVRECIQEATSAGSNDLGLINLVVRLPLATTKLTGNNHPDVVYCDICKMQPIIGYRYRCLICKDMDICSRCEARDLHPGHNMMRLVKSHSVPNKQCHLKPKPVQTVVKEMSSKPVIQSPESSRPQSPVPATKSQDTSTVEEMNDTEIGQLEEEESSIMEANLALLHSWGCAVTLRYYQTLFDELRDHNFVVDRIMTDKLQAEEEVLRKWNPPEFPEQHQIMCSDNEQSSVSCEGDHLAQKKDSDEDEEVLKKESSMDCGIERRKQESAETTKNNVKILQTTYKVPITEEIYEMILDFYSGNHRTAFKWIKNQKDATEEELLQKFQESKQTSGEV